MMIYFFVLHALMRVFKREIFGFSYLLAEKIYFLICTTKGKAISKSDFKIIKQVNEKLYELISMQRCRGYCYSICFRICKVLKKGSIEFLAVKKFSLHDKEDGDEKNFIMHVLYVNNGWAFDTYSSNQYPLEKLHKIYKAKVYKTFSYEEISGKSYEEFKEKQEHELTKCSNDNDCFMFLKVDNDET